MKKSIYAEIESIHEQLHGWCPLDKGIALASLVLSIKPTLVLEIGTFGGKSAIPMLLALRQLGSGRLICLDPWSADKSAEGQTNESDRKWWAEVDHEEIYQKFLELLKQLKLSEFCEVRRMTSAECEPPTHLDCLHSDGNHGPDALADVKKFAPAVRQRGFVVLDDLNWAGGYVRQAETWLLGNGFIKLYDLGTGAIYMRL